MKITVRIDGERFDVQVGNLYERPVIATVDGVQYEVWPEGEAAFQHKSSNQQEAIIPLTKLNTSNGLSVDSVGAPIPGLIFLLKVAEGDRVVVGQEICILEAMKMKNVIRSPRDGQIKAVMVENGQQVAAGEVLVVFESEELEI